MQLSTDFIKRMALLHNLKLTWSGGPELKPRSTLLQLLLYSPLKIKICKPTSATKSIHNHNGGGNKLIRQERKELAVVCQIDIPSSCIKKVSPSTKSGFTKLHL